MFSRIIVSIVASSFGLALLACSPLPSVAGEKTEDRSRAVTSTAGGAAPNVAATSSSSSSPLKSTTAAKGELTKEVVEYSYDDDMLKSAHVRIMDLKDAKHIIEVQRSRRRIVIIDRTSNRQIELTARFAGRKTADLAGLKQMVKLYPKSKPVMLALSMGYEDERNWAKAIETRDLADSLGAVRTERILLTPTQIEVVKSDDRAGSLSKRGYYECMMGKYDAAIKNLSEAIALRPKYHMNYRNRMIAYEKLGRKKDAESDRLKLQQLFDTKTVRYSALSEPEITLFAITDGVSEDSSFEEGIEAINELLKKYPDYYPLYACRADYETYTGAYKNALQDFNILLRRNSSKAYQDERQHLVDLVKNGAPQYGDLTKIKTNSRYELARGKIVTAKDLAKMHAGDMRVYVAIFRGLVEQQKMAEAQLEGKKILSVCPLRKRFRSAFNYLEDGTDSETIEACSDYLSDPNVVSYEYVSLGYATRARALVRMKDYQRAIADYGKLIELEPKSAEAFRDRADCYMNWKHYKDAIQDYSSAIANDVDRSKSNYAKRAKAYAAIGETALAKRDSEMFAQLDLGAKAK